MGTTQVTSFEVTACPFALGGNITLCYACRSLEHTHWVQPACRCRHAKEGINVGASYEYGNFLEDYFHKSFLKHEVVLLLTGSGNLGAIYSVRGLFLQPRWTVEEDRGLRRNAALDSSSVVSCRRANLTSGLRLAK